MSYVADGSLADLYPADFVEKTSRDIVQNVQGQLATDAKRLTPVAHIPQAYFGDYPAWEEDRGGRPPGTLKEAWVELPIEQTSAGFSGSVENTDPVASHVEYDTQPHMIFARKAKTLRFPSGPVFRYRPWVYHPGTQGQHMLRDAEVGIEATWVGTAERTLDLHAALN